MKNSIFHMQTIFLFFIMCLSLVGTSKAKRPELNAIIIYSDDSKEFTVINKDNYNWSNITVFINYDYYYRIKLINSNGSYIIKMDQFKNKEGEIFHGRMISSEYGDWYWIRIDAKQGEYYISIE